MVDVCHAMNFRTHKTIETRDIALTRSGNLVSLTLLDTSIKSNYWQQFVLTKINSQVHSSTIL